MPPRLRVYTPIEYDTALRQTDLWEKQGVVEEASPALAWTNNLVFVAKANGAIRTCVDCRPANAVTKAFDWPLPRLQDLRHKLRHARWFARIDLKDAFFRIKVPKQWRYLTAYRLGAKNYQFRRMAFGLKTAPSTFQRFMDTTLAALFIFIFCYLDDILIFATTLSDLRRKVRRVKNTLKERGCEINEEKSLYDSQGLLFAGMWVYPGGLGPNHQKVKEVLAIAPPRNDEEKRSALGLVSYLREHIPLVSLLTASLSGSNTSYDKDEFVQEWNKLLRHIAKSITTIGHWSENEDADLYTDASMTGVAAVLIQNGRIIAVASRKLTGAETRYQTTDREHLSILLAAERMKVFLHRPKGVTRVWNDHEALLNRKVEEMKPRQARTWETVNQWIPELRWVPGRNNPADYFSRWQLEILGGQISTISS